MPNFLTRYNNVTMALSYYRGFSEPKIVQLMKPGKGPHIQVVSNLVNTFGEPLYGYYDSSTKTLKISQSFVTRLENSPDGKNEQALALLLAITTLHEFVHYGRDVNQLKDLYTDPNTGQISEAGVTFEMNISANRTVIDKNNAIQWIKFYPFNF